MLVLAARSRPLATAQMPGSNPPGGPQLTLAKAIVVPSGDHVERCCIPADDDTMEIAAVDVHHVDATGSLVRVAADECEPPPIW